MTTQPLEHDIDLVYGRCRACRRGVLDIRLNRIRYCDRGAWLATTEAQRAPDASLFDERDAS